MTKNFCPTLRAKVRTIINKMTINTLFHKRCFILNFIDMRINTVTLNPLKLFNHTLFHNSYRKYYLASIAYHNSCRRFALGICNHRNYRKDFLLHLLHDNLDILFMKFLGRAFAKLLFRFHIHRKLVVENENKVLPLPLLHKTKPKKTILPNH